MDAEIRGETVGSGQGVPDVAEATIGSQRLVHEVGNHTIELIGLRVEQAVICCRRRPPGGRQECGRRLIGSPGTRRCGVQS